MAENKFDVVMNYGYFVAEPGHTRQGGVVHITKNKTKVEVAPDDRRTFLMVTDEPEVIEIMRLSEQDLVGIAFTQVDGDKMGSTVEYQLEKITALIFGMGLMEAINDLTVEDSGQDKLDIKGVQAWLQ